MSHLEYRILESDWVGILQDRVNVLLGSTAGNAGAAPYWQLSGGMHQQISRNGYLNGKELIRHTYVQAMVLVSEPVY